MGFPILVFCTLNFSISISILVFPIFIENLIQRFEWIFS